MDIWRTGDGDRGTSTRMFHFSSWCRSHETPIYTDSYLIFYKYDNTPCVYSAGSDIPSVCFSNTDSVRELMFVSICSAPHHSCIFSIHTLFFWQFKGCCFSCRSSLKTELVPPVLSRVVQN